MKSAAKNKYRVVIGLEVHAQLLTRSKIFAWDSTAFGQKPNTNITPITLGHPGTLPRLNKQAVEYAMKMGLACHSEISRFNIFDRKNYFYPDLPKGYQITQDKTPICLGGYVKIKTEKEEKEVRLHKIHLEEDAGKSIHTADNNDTLVDLNRAGVPLIEIVTEPDMDNSDQAAAFLTEVRKMVRYLDICDGNMEEGSLRCDANISIMLKDATKLGNKVEVKNMNSIKNVQKAIDHEISRQIALKEAGHEIVSETRLFDANTITTHSMRSKEQLTDYRYFPEPDLSPLIISDEWLESVKANMPAMPEELLQELLGDFQLPEYDAAFISESKEMVTYFKAACQHNAEPKKVANWLMGPIQSWLNEQSCTITSFPVSPEKLAQLITLVDSGKVSFSAANQHIFPQLLANPEAVCHQIAEQMNLVQESNTSSIQPMINQVLDKFPDKVKEYKKGKKGLIGMFMGEVMKLSRGKADPKLTNQLLRQSLES
ncbi:MAG: Asp-tRNA(Asn)/Glu-tRNA(Gln) amidotransferase subunit GatB [Cyclobacteriaceae bacterium]